MPKRSSRKPPSRSKARASAAPGTHAKGSPQPLSDELSKKALRRLSQKWTLKDTAKEAGVSAGRLRRSLYGQGFARREGRRWIITDTRPREVAIIARGGERMIKVSGFEPASLVMRHRAAVRAFVEEPTPEAVARLRQEFGSQTVTDTAGQTFEFEVRPNALLRLVSAGGQGFETVYRLTT
jgi:hypothetical protein